MNTTSVPNNLDYDKINEFRRSVVAVATDSDFAAELDPYTADDWIVDGTFGVSLGNPQYDSSCAIDGDDLVCYVGGDVIGRIPLAEILL